MPYPYALQCRETLPADVIAMYDVTVTTGGSITSVLSPCSKHGKSNIFLAACDGDVPALRMFLGAGVDINSMGEPSPQYGPQFNRRTLFRAPPLCYAAGYGREKAVAALLEDGADPLKTSSTGFKAIDYARHRGYMIIVEMLEAAERGQHSGEPAGKE
ncbi:ankyrin repeat protein [Trypanosoma rangeli]|uniref:Ankyrin repeat protein n=1 Tax=Trypanosoma rangeli TaxID=5698 RepID=A0A422N7G5_TRYRA|nr:ankyrin repeat protein [Trypanosoma rangeli]RNF01382.1 ankyrin repeat protein [Trypanosoma rangeli]|eukprot:RNF01382.1 ankyrin repeat protein [Trypanosoma rangeli]